MKKFILATSISLVMNACCTSTPSNENLDLSTFYEPHVAITHHPNNDEKHYYSVLSIIKKGEEFYEKMDCSPDSIAYEVSYSTTERDDPYSRVKAEYFPLNDEYVLCIARYPIGNNNNNGNKIDSSLFKTYDEEHYHKNINGILTHFGGTLHKPNPTQ